MSNVDMDDFVDTITNDDVALFTEFRSLLGIMRKLRDPQLGCPWDLEQTFSTIAPYTIEESYEVADAIERQDYTELKSELGDLLFQIVFHSYLANELNLFSLKDIIKSINNKLIDRNPHVFNDVGSRTSQEQSKAWEDQKAEERKFRAKSGLLDDIPIGLPGLLRAVKLTKRAARVGFDWPDIDSVLSKLDEEVCELKAEIALDNKDRIASEIGDVFFTVANLARKYDLDPEYCVRLTNSKFVNRFSFIESDLQKCGRSFADCDLSFLESLWLKAKVNS